MSKRKPAPVLTFDAEQHKYYLDGRPLLGVTSVLSAAFGDPWKNVPPASREYALQLGSAVHKWTQFVDEGRPERPTGEHMLGYLSAWERFKADYGAELLAVEERVVSVRYQYAGTLDRVLVITKQVPFPAGLRTLLDIKTGVQIHPFASIQTAAYQQAWEEMHHPQKIHHRMTVLLQQGGTYKLEDHPDRNDINIFKAALSVVAWKQRNSLTMETEI